MTRKKRTTRQAREVRRLLGLNFVDAHRFVKSRDRLDFLYGHGFDFAPAPGEYYGDNTFALKGGKVVAILDSSHWPRGMET